MSMQNSLRVCLRETTDLRIYFKGIFKQEPIFKYRDLKII